MQDPWVYAAFWGPRSSCYITGVAKIKNLSAEQEQAESSWFDRDPCLTLDLPVDVSKKFRSPYDKVHSIFWALFWDPCLWKPSSKQEIPTLGVKYVNLAYFGLFGAQGLQ